MQTRIVKDEYPCVRRLSRARKEGLRDRDPLRGSRRRSALRSAASSKLRAFSARRLLSRLASDAPSSPFADPMGRPTATKIVYPRHLVKDGASAIRSAFSRQTRSFECMTHGRRFRRQKSRCSIPRSSAWSVELDRAPAHSRNRTRTHRSENRLPESASSQKHEHDSRASEPRTLGAFSAPKRCPERGCEPRSTWKPG